MSSNLTIKRLLKQLKKCCPKGEGIVDHSIVTRWFKKFHLNCKNLDDQAKLGRSKTVDYEIFRVYKYIIPLSAGRLIP